MAFLIETLDLLKPVAVETGKKDGMCEPLAEWEPRCFSLTIRAFLG
jgi:hypothetical protein